MKFEKVLFTDDFVEKLEKLRHIKLIINRKIGKNRLQEILESKGYTCLAIDEVNIFSLAGPALSCVIKIKPQKIRGVKDSKQLTRKQIYRLAETIKKRADMYAFGIVWPQEINEEVSIQKASHLSKLRALGKLNLSEKIVLLVDYYPIPEFHGYSIGVLYGDEKVFSISCASILAKAYVNRIMEELDKEYPQYGWKTNCGSPTKQHYEAIKKYGLTKWHRIDFCKKFPQLKGYI